MKIRLLTLILALTLAACGQPRPASKAVYLLVDTSGTYTEELGKAQAILNYLLATLESGDSIAVARIDSGSFSEKDVIAKATFDDRPSMANDQKRLFKSNMDQFVTTVKRGSAHTDITGAILQAAEFLNETAAGEKYVLVFSDLAEDLAKGQIRNFPLDLHGIHVVALNVTKLRTDNIDPRDYLKRVGMWQKRVVDGGGDWRVVNDFDRLDTLIALQ